MQEEERWRRYFRHLNDDSIHHVVMNETRDLTPAAVRVLQAEVQRRQYPPEISASITSRLKALVGIELESLVQWFRTCPCPICGKQGLPLNACPIVTVTSFLIATSKNASVIVGCPECIRKAARKAQSKTVIAGWWGLPWGPIHTIGALGINRRAQKITVSEGPSEHLTTYVRQNIGSLTALKEKR